MTSPAQTPDRTGVMVVGSISVDLTTFSSRFPTPGETITGDDFTTVLGGKGANQASAAALAGAAVHLVGAVGTDVFGDFALEGLQRLGVLTERVVRSEGATGVAHIRVDGAGENDIVIVPLANGRVEEQRVDAAFAELAGVCGVLLTQLETTWAITERAIRSGRRAGMIVILDPAPAVQLDDAIWADVDIVTPNETEASVLTGIRVVDEESAARAGRYFTDRGAGHALITLGADGALLVSPSGVTRYAPIRVTAVDTTAAGDAFAGCLGAALAEGLPLDAAIPRAIAAGALAVTKRGASPSLPTREEVDTLLATVR